MHDPERPLRDLSSFEIQRQPTDVTCGPTCLHAVYRYFGDAISLEEVLAQVPSLEEGGTLGVLLACHALARGYRATIVTWNLQVFDPTWFEPDVDLRDKLLRRRETTIDRKLRLATRSYVDFLDAGGTVEYRDLDADLLRGYLHRGIPVMSGLSATFLYRESREQPTGEIDDVGGDPVGHFVVLTGHRRATDEVAVSDPFPTRANVNLHNYLVKMDRLIGSIYLGVLTFDANLIVVEPQSGPKERA